ncbi:MAG: hypothetical protein AAFX85_09600 [Pseudomonadota bacterium]
MTGLPPPSLFPVHINARTERVGFLPTTREALSAAPFLDQRFAGTTSPAKYWTVRELLEHVDGLPLPPMIFHTAFCCSTLLATAFDHPGRLLALKEPDLIMQLANLKRVHSPLRSDPGRFSRWLQLTLVLLGRRFEADEKVLLKPTNAAANLLMDVARLNSPMLLLYSDLRAFLVSVIKKGEAGRWFVRHLLNILRLDGALINDWQERERMAMTDLQVAALVWWLQIDNYLAFLDRTLPGQRVGTLDATAFLEQPAVALAAVNDQLKLSLPVDMLTRAANGPAFQRHSKFADLEYDAAQRADERASIEAAHGEAIEVTLAWAAQLRGSPDALPHAIGRLQSASVLRGLA